MKQINNLIKLIELKINQDIELKAAFQSANAELNNLDVIQKLVALNSLKNVFSKMGLKL